MKWSWRGKAAAPAVDALTRRVEQLHAELTKTQEALRSLELEQIDVHDRVKKWMRRAVVAERNQERAAGPAAETRVTPALRSGFGARARWGLNRPLPGEAATNGAAHDEEE